MTSLDSILKSRDITLSTKVHLVKAMVFPVVMFGCESWNIKKAECWRIDAFGPWCWRRLLRVSWTSRRPNQSILKEINLGCSLIGLMLKLQLQYFGHLMWRADSFEKTLILGKIEGRRRRGRQRMRWLDGITDSMDMGLGGLQEYWWWTGRPDVLRFMGSQRAGHDWVTELSYQDGLVGSSAVPGTLKSLFQHHSSKASILWHPAFFIVQISHPYMTTGKTIALTRQTLWTKQCLCFLICCLGWS